MEVEIAYSRKGSIKHIWDRFWSMVFEEQDTQLKKKTHTVNGGSSFILTVLISFKALKL